MEFTAQTTGDGICRLSLDGNLDIYCAAEAKPRLMAELSSHPQLELDLSNVGALDSAGLQLLALAKIESRRQGSELRFVAHSAAVREVIEFYNMAGFFGDPLVIPAGEANQGAIHG